MLQNVEFCRESSTVRSPLPSWVSPRCTPSHNTFLWQMWYPAQNCFISEILTVHPTATPRTNNVFLACSPRNSSSEPQTSAPLSTVLSVPVQGMEAVLKEIGKCSSEDTNKFRAFGINCCRPGWVPLSEAEHRVVAGTGVFVCPCTAVSCLAAAVSGTQLCNSQHQMSEKMCLPPGRSLVPIRTTDVGAGVGVVWVL